MSTSSCGLPAVPLASTINPQPIAAFHTLQRSNLAYSNTVDLSTSLWSAEGPNLLEKLNTSVVKVVGSLFIAFSCARSLPSPAEPFSEKKNTNPTQTTTEHLPSAFLRLLKNSELVTFSVGMNKRSPDIADLCPKFTCNQMAFCKLVEKSSDSVFSQYFALEHASALPGFGQDQKWKCWNTMRQTVRLRFPTHFSRPKQSKAVLINSWNFWIPSWTEPLYFSFWVAQRCPFLLMGCWSSLKAQISLSPAQSHTQAYPKEPPSAQFTS